MFIIVFFCFVSMHPYKMMTNASLSSSFCFVFVHLKKMTTSKCSSSSFLFCLCAPKEDDNEHQFVIVFFFLKKIYAPKEDDDELVLIIVSFLFVYVHPKKITFFLFCFLTTDFKLKL